MDATSSILLVHAGATWFLAGLVWFVQLVHYPLFDRVEGRSFRAFEAEHQRRTTWIVGPAMLLEAAAALALVVDAPAGLPATWPSIGLALLAAIWVSTAIVQVPLHRRLARGFDRTAHRRLVRGNWLRTLAWTARAVLAVAMIPAAAV